MRALRFCLLLLVALVLAVPAQAQTSPVENTERRTVEFYGYGRAALQQTTLGGDLSSSDSLTAPNISDGEFVLDLALNAQPNQATEVQAVLRMRNEFGGFFGEGAVLEVRELWARGLIANRFQYRVGDMDMALTPYTLFLPDAEGTVNMPDIFRPQRDVVAYEQFYTDNNERRLQGGTLNFGLAFAQGLETLDVTGFVARTRPTDFTTTPSRFLSGGRVAVATQPLTDSGLRGQAGFNLSYLWDDLGTGAVDAGIRNATYTLDFDVTLLDRSNLGLSLVGETGQARVEQIVDDMTALEEDDTFLDIGAQVDLKELGLNVQASFVDVGPDFFNAAAQSRRVDFDRTKSFYNRVGNSRGLRPATLFDLTRDVALYSFTLESSLMDYDPRFSNVLPYGAATPNRRGARIMADYVVGDDALVAGLETHILQEIRGQGTTNLKDFLLVRADATVQIDQFVGWERSVRATLGLQSENTSRDSDLIEQTGDRIGAIDLSSTLVELGLAAEVYPRLELLLGATFRSSDGNEFVPIIENFNDVRDFPSVFTVDDQESLLGAGFRYAFRDDVFLTVQAQRFGYSDEETTLQDYSFGQVYVLYSMTF
ncbi:MAG: hypothetical protein AAGI71_12620 [Bacteroidota bacterium]